jgi:hypothetical protein
MYKNALLKSYYINQNLKVLYSGDGKVKVFLPRWARIIEEKRD